MKKKNNKKMNKASVSIIAIIALLLGVNYQDVYNFVNDNIVASVFEKKEEVKYSYNINEIPPYSGSSYVVINDNIPNFTESDKTTKSFESYSNLDSLGRCGVAFSNIGKDLMPTDERGSIGMIKPSGWHTVKYDIVDGKYLYNRCHLIGYQLTGENANDKNLITCTRYMNTVGMLEWENKVASYIKETNNHVLYRVTPIFEEDNLLATGVEMEAYSVEDNGKGIMFHVFVYNIQDGITIDYKTGESKLSKKQKLLLVYKEKIRYTLNVIKNRLLSILIKDYECLLVVLLLYGYFEYFTFQKSIKYLFI